MSTTTWTVMSVYERLTRGRAPQWQWVASLRRGARLEMVVLTDGRTEDTSNVDFDTALQRAEDLAAARNVVLAALATVWNRCAVCDHAVLWHTVPVPGFHHLISGGLDHLLDEHHDPQPLTADGEPVDGACNCDVDRACSFPPCVAEQDAERRFYADLFGSPAKVEAFRPLYGDDRC